MVKKGFFSLVLLVVLTLLALYGSASAHCYLTEGATYPVPDGFADFAKMTAYVFDGKAKLFFCLFEVAAVTFIGFVFYSQHLQNLKNDMRRITPNIATPVPAGNGEHGTADWLPQSEYKSNFGCQALPSARRVKRYLKRREENHE